MMRTEQTFASSELFELLSDIDRQPIWRPESARCADYYDGKQLEPAQIEVLKARGQPVMVHNLIASAVDGVLGMEAKTRQGVMVRADDDESLEVAEGLNERVNEMSRMMETDRHCSDAFAGQTKSGLGWVEVNRSAPGDRYPYRTGYVHRDEIWWDWNSKRADLSDARWLLRKRWLDEDEAIAFFPKHEALIKNACGGWADFAYELENQTLPALSSAYQDYDAYNWNDTELFDTDRRRVRVYEIWHRRFEKGYMLYLHASAREVRYDEGNQFHNALISAGHAKLVSRPQKRMYRAWLIGPHVIANEPSNLPHDDFPYTPFFGYREDGSGVPYGIVRRMLSPQDEYNFRRSKLTYLLNSKLVVMDGDATEMSDQDLVEEINRPDGIVKLNQNRKNRENKGFWVEQAGGIVAQQFTIMNDAKQQVQDAAGIFSAMLGQESNATSGVAINGLIEQGNTTLAELFDNYRYARKKVYEQVLAFAVADIRRDPTDVQVNLNNSDKTKVIQLNRIEVDEDNVQSIRNDVMNARLHVVLDDITNTAGYRAQLTERMMALVQTLPGQYQAVLLDLVLDSTDMPNKQEALKRIRKLTGQGMNPEELTPEERQQLDEQQKKQAMMEQLELREITAKIADMEAEAARKQSAAQKDQAAITSAEIKDDQVEAQTLKVLAELKEITQRLEGSAFERSGYSLVQPPIQEQVTRVA